MGDPQRYNGAATAEPRSKACGVFAVCLLLAACGPAEVTFIQPMTTLHVCRTGGLSALKDSSLRSAISHGVRAKHGAVF